MSGAPLLGVGIDLVDIERMRRSLARTPTLKTRLFTAAEREYAELRRSPAERYAVRFAAKEAFLKSLGVGLGAASFVDIEVVRLDSGRPVLRLGSTAETLALEAGAVDFHLSMTHGPDAAHAIVLAFAATP